MKNFEVKVKLVPANYELELKKLIDDLIEYSYEAEEKHYEESEFPTDHIFPKIIRLKELSEYL